MRPGRFARSNQVQAGKSPDHQQARCDPNKKSREQQACISLDTGRGGSPEPPEAIGPSRVATLAAQSTISCACPRHELHESSRIFIRLELTMSSFRVN